jgi:hypothetical protein
VLMGRGLGDEGAIALHSDTPHYLLNGVFLSDLLKDHPLGAPMAYARTYFARYPGLTLGLHPLLTPIVEMPFLAAFGVSVRSGRLGVLCTLAVMILLWFRFIEKTYDTATAFVSSLLLASSPSLVTISHQVESEPLALCMIMVALLFLQRFCNSERVGDGLAFLAAVVLSLYAKQLTAMLLPVYALQYARTFGYRSLLSRRALAGAGAVAICALPVVPLTLHYSQFNVQVVTNVSAQARLGSRSLVRLASAVTASQVGLLTVVAALLAAGGAVARRDGRVWLLLSWVASVCLGLLAIGVYDERYACYSAMAFCGLAGSLITVGRSALERRVLLGFLVVALGQQVLISARLQPNGGGGYDEAARFVVEHRVGDSVLYCATEDGGFFVFFVRKHDPQRQMIVLRADKVLTTSRMFVSDFARVIQRREDIAPILQQFGVGYVVIEDRQTRDGPLEWLRQMVHGDHFELRRQIPIVTSEKQLRGVSLGIYEYKDRTPADPDARLSMNIPLMNDTIAITFRDLLGPVRPQR